MTPAFVTYLRVSTRKQGDSGLGLEAQKTAVSRHCSEVGGTILGEFVEVESGKNDDRPRLAEAMKLCRLTGAVLLIAKLDRLGRDAAFLLGLAKAGIEFEAADMPNANRMTVGIMAVVAEQEREMISQRTKAALAAAKARGVKLGGWRGGSAPDHTKATHARIRKADAFAASVLPIIQGMQAEGMSLRSIAAALTDRGIRTARGGAWTATAVTNLLTRTREQEPA